LYIYYKNTKYLIISTELSGSADEGWSRLLMRELLQVCSIWP